MRETQETLVFVNSNFASQHQDRLAILNNIHLLTNEQAAAVKRMDSWLVKWKYSLDAFEKELHDRETLADDQEYELFQDEEDLNNREALLSEWRESLIKREERIIRRRRRLERMKEDLERQERNFEQRVTENQRSSENGN